MKEEKISIVIPVYNATNYLEKCLDSVVNQTYANIEIILVDDGSTDDSGKICDTYAKKDLRIMVVHQDNSGVSSARNKGILKASGKYIAFIDADDMVHSNYIKCLVGNLNGDNLSVCQIKNFYDDIGFHDVTSDNGQIKLNKNEFIELCPLYLLNTPCCKLYDLNVLRKNKILFDTKLSLGEDLLFNLDYLKYIDKIVITNQKLYYYRKDNNNTLSTSYNPNMVDIQILLFDKYTEFFMNSKMSNHALGIFDSYRFSTLKIIIENEFRNKRISFWLRYFNVRKLLNDNRFQSRIKSIHYSKNQFMCFLIRHKLILIYKIINKIKSII